MFSNLENPKLPQKNPKYFCCETCDFLSSNKKDYIRHLQTIKHKNSICQPFSTEKQCLSTEKPILPNENAKFKCLCGKIYKDKSGIWRHKKKCNSMSEQPIQLENDSEYTDEEHSEEHSEQEKPSNYKSLPSNNEIIEILKVQMVENQELRKFMMEQQKQMMELASKATINNTINSNSNCNNNNNNTFNLQVFLNEKCKDALNINEFVDSIKIQMSDLENFAHLDYPDGVSKIFVKNLNNVDTYLRPIHCSDLKREVLYIKNNNEWVKETDDKTLLKNAIKKIANKNIRQINEWVKEHPGCQDPRTKQNVKYNKIVMNSMSGVTVEEQQENMEQIMKNVTKAVVIDKYAVK